jgi:hypothetical protein
MFTRRLAWAAVATLALAGSARAQTAQPITTSNLQRALGGVSPSSVIGKKVDTSNAISGGPKMSNATSSFSFLNFFRQAAGFGSPTIGRSNIPAPMYPSAVTPLPPINSTIRR